MFGMDRPFKSQLDCAKRLMGIRTSSLTVSASKSSTA